MAAPPKTAVLPGQQISFSDLKFSHTDVLGQGSSATVYRGKCRETEVAIKFMRNSVDFSMLRSEIMAMRECPHPNILLYLGAVDDGGDIYVVTEFCSGGDLHVMLHADKEKRFLPLLTRMGWAEDIAKGIAWLHFCGFLHRDLKPANVFLTANWVAKIGDFGFAVKRQLQTENFKGSALWMAPEKLSLIGETPKTDVYAFGIMLWELLTQQTPFESYTDLSDFTQAVVRFKERPPIPSNCPNSIRALMEACWHQNPGSRPKSENIVPFFTQIFVESAIGDVGGREFWVESFGTQDSVDVGPFFDKLFMWTNYVPQEKDQMRAWLASSFPAIPDGNRKKVTPQQFGWILRWFAPLGRTPKFLDRVRSIWQNDFFWGHLPADTAKTYLTGQPEGTFLIRFSSKEPTYGQYTLSRVLATGKDAVHTRIEYDTQARRYSYAESEGGRPCKSLESLVSHTHGLVRPLQEVTSVGRFRPLISEEDEAQYLSVEEINTSLKGARNHRADRSRLTKSPRDGLVPALMLPKSQDRTRAPQLYT